MGKFADQMQEMSKDKIQDYKVAAKVDKFEKVAAAQKGDKEAGEKAEKRQEGIDKANARLATKAEGTEEMGKFAQMMEDTWGTSTPLKKKGGYENGNRKATVHRDVDWNEYRVKHHVDGVHQKEADYHTDDKEEAHDHAKHWVSQAPKNESAEDLGESIDQVDELSKGTLAGYLSANRIDSIEKSKARGVIDGRQNSRKGTSTPEEDKTDGHLADKLHQRQKGFYKGLKKLMSKNEQATLAAFNEKAEEFTPHRSDHTGVVYHLNKEHATRVKDMKHGGIGHIEAVHHDGYNLHVNKYEAHKVHNTVHLHDRSGNHVDSFKAQ